MSFTRKIEDFICEHCGQTVKGTGYTNHCPQCLWSKHVDQNPGDRAEACGGTMAPIRVEGGTDAYVLIHRCEKCGVEKRNKVDARDSSAALLTIAKGR
ncbi:MAG: RNHCP domain-containing protein [Candidatus Kaiserbacteria bacterium]|nr:MAG: RNHCP domain-containing protein [Candidatus Kaiserbacteria bacterium]